MKLLSTEELEASAVVANCRMNRERVLHGSNGYDRDLRFDPLEFLKEALNEKDEVAWLDLCCGTGKALIEATAFVEQDNLPISIVGVDLVGMFDSHQSSSLRLVEASLSSWKPDRDFDLITCVHGLHYIGDKLGLISRALSWLSGGGRFAANLDPANVRIVDGASSQAISLLRRAGLTYSPRHKLLRADDVRNLTLPVSFVGADDQVGPNYTGQPAVDSWYQSLPESDATEK